VVCEPGTKGEAGSIDELAQPSVSVGVHVIDNESDILAQAFPEDRILKKY
jgi:hypothetical protein